ncbi:3-methyladenine DNA glycosylase AlkC [Terribacillus aidingensis]|uniref:3-methyladenine DNA glycosylase AlkC n=1 Tax=Terribacillus aidingensis TaxID=586416 RepID=A0A285MZR0_9BACI|nr:DNA alkylation repair protein [Terribacillus aidingensis]SNZ02669.1 3-methyladenine DNA glycosylase AlkC [Terribacillus aidingensis]
MAEPMKAMYTKEFLEHFASVVKEEYEVFAENKFLAEVMDDSWEELELKARIRRIALVLGSLLPDDYPEAVTILLAIEAQCEGFPYLFIPDFVEIFGQDPAHEELSLHALEVFTKRSTAEFAIRPFLIKAPERIMNKMKEWAQSKNYHIRRLASEGCRPRLPWGQAIRQFKADPQPVLEVLELLKADPSLYVRKSVANNLNDISKDHPELVIQTAKRWNGYSKETDWIIRHGCRTLLRSGQPEVLALFGYEDVKGALADAAIAADRQRVNIGEAVTLTYSFHVKQQVKLRIEYSIDFIKKRKITTKKFLLSDRVFAAGEDIAKERVHKWSDFTTRVHYPGVHRIALLANGIEVAGTELELIKKE